MKHPLYCIRDVKTSFYEPTIDKNDDAAIRNFALMVNTNQLAAFNPADFSFYRVGFFDSEKGVIEPELPPVWLADGSGVFGK